MAELRSPVELSAALDLRAEGWVPLAAGCRLLPRWKGDPPERILDLSRLAVLRGIHEEGEALRIGALSPLSALADASDPLLARAARGIGAPWYRNRATLGGQLGSGWGGRGLSVALLARDAQLELASRDGGRSVSLEDFAQAPLAADELLVAVRIARPREGERVVFRRVSVNARSPARLLLAGWVLRQEDQVEELRVAFGALEGRALRARRVEEALRGQRLNAQALRHLDADLGEGDGEALEPYRRKVACNLLRTWIESLS